MRCCWSEGLAAWYLHRLQHESTCFVAETLVKVEAAEEIQSHCQQLRNELAVDRLLDREVDRAKLAHSREEIERWIRKGACTGRRSLRKRRF